MKKILAVFPFLIFASFACADTSTETAKNIEIRTVYNEDGSLHEIIFVDFTDTGETISVRIGSEEIYLTVDENGELINKDEIKLLARLKYKARLEKIAQEREKIRNTETINKQKKNALKLSITKEDLKK